MSEHDDFTVMWREFVQRFADQISALKIFSIRIRLWFVGLDKLWPITALLKRFQRAFATTAVSARFVVAKVQRDAPQKRGELSGRLPIFPPGEDSRESR